MTKQEKQERQEALRAHREAIQAERAKRTAAAKASPIAQAVQPMLEDAMKAAEDWAKERIEYVCKELEAAGWDREVAAPFPRGEWDRREYMKKKARYELFRFFTAGRSSSRGMREPDFCDMNAERCTLFITEAKESAAGQYEAFVEKLVYKIGDVTSATLEGNHVWGYSTLTVTKPDGSVEKWRTQQITNVSKLGKYFPQWPSRKVK